MTASRASRSLLPPTAPFTKARSWRCKLPHPGESRGLLNRDKRAALLALKELIGSRLSPGRRKTWNDGRASEPVIPLEAVIKEAAQSEDEGKDDEIAILPFELGHVVEIHSIDAGESRRHGENGGPGREHAGDGALLRLAHHQARFESEGQNLSQ